MLTGYQWTLDEIIDYLSFEVWKKRNNNKSDKEILEEILGDGVLPNTDETVVRIEQTLKIIQ